VIDCGVRLQEHGNLLQPGPGPPRKGRPAAPAAPPFPPRAAMREKV